MCQPKKLASVSSTTVDSFSLGSLLIKWKRNLIYCYLTHSIYQLICLNCLKAIQNMKPHTGTENRCRSRIWSSGGAQFPRPKVADVAEWSCTSKANYLQSGSRAHLRTLEAFGFLMLKYAFSHILETFFL